MSSAYDAIKCDIPPGLRLGLSKLISFDIEVRPTAQQLLMVGQQCIPLSCTLSCVTVHKGLNTQESHTNLVQACVNHAISFEKCY